NSYFYGHAGLRHLLSESGVYAAGTVNDILTGKDFDRALTAFKMIDEALNSRLLTNFEAWCIENDIDLDEDLEEMLKAFVSERLIAKPDGSDPPVKGFFSPMTRSKVKTMATSKIKTQVKRTNNINSEVMFQRLLAVNAYKKVSTERVFAFENTPVPTSLFSEDGTMLKCKKSDFMTMLEGLLPDKITHIHKADTLIFDGMALVQSLSPQSEHLTFRYMAEMFMKHVFKKASNIANVKTVHIVFDRYSNISLKTQTRNGRGDSSTKKALHIHGDLAIPKDWKGFLSVGKNKERLIAYYTDYIVQNSAPVLKGGESLFISGGAEDKCFLLTDGSCEEIKDLRSNHEEADTRIIIHSAYAKKKGL
ncbi:hypothetical protein MAR_027744, partial [Mya arenaria]